MLKYLLVLISLFSSLTFAEPDIFANLETEIRLKVGSDAPKLSDVLWLKPEPAALFTDAEKIYLIEFWGTWCGPCVAAIPHLNELAKKYAGKVEIVGIAAREIGAHRGERLDSLNKFLSNPESPLQDYPIAYGSPSVRDRWLKASMAPGIPNAYLVKGSKIVWEGHPMQSEPVLVQILDGTWDVETFKKSALAEKVASVAYDRLKNALKTNGSLQQKLKWVQEYISRFENNRAARMKELVLLSQMGESHYRELLDKLQAVLDSTDLYTILFAVYTFNNNETLQPFAKVAVDRALQLMAEDAKAAKDMEGYAQYYFKDLVDVLIQSQDLSNAQKFVNQALMDISAAEEADPEMEALWNTKAQALQTAQQTCRDGVCEVPAQSLACDQALKPK